MHPPSSAQLVTAATDNSHIKSTAQQPRAGIKSELSVRHISLFELWTGVWIWDSSMYLIIISRVWYDMVIAPQSRM
eukprot:6173104-Pleurochrysis_carterae.AAC.1